MHSINQKNTQTQIEENCSIFLQRFFSLHIEHASCSKFCCWGGHCTQWMLAHYHLLPHTLLQWVSRMCCSACVLHNLNTSGIWRVNAMFEKTLETQDENMVIKRSPFWQQMQQMMMNSHAGYGVKEDHIPMTDETDCACSYWNIKCTENPSRGIAWKMLASCAPSSLFVNKAKDRQCPAHENPDVLGEDSDRKLRTDYFIWVGSNRWVKFRHPHHAVVVFCAQADKTFISWAFWIHWTTPTGPSQSPTQWVQSSRLDGENLSK